MTSIRKKTRMEKMKMTVSSNPDYSESDLDDEEEDEEWEPEEDEEELEEEEAEVRIVPPLLPPPPGFGTPTAALYCSDCKTSMAKRYAARFDVPQEYGLCCPRPEHRAHAPPPGYATIYTQHFLHGLRLPLPPFVVSLLAKYGIALAQLHPISIFPILGFMELCKSVSVTPTPTLFRRFFRLKTISLKGQHTEGWYTFQGIPPKIVYGRPTGVTWRTSFLFFKTAPENVSLSSWNHSAIVDPPLAENEMPAEETVSRLLAGVKHPSKRKRADVRCSSKRAAVHPMPLESEGEERMIEANSSMASVPKPCSLKKKAATEMQAKKSSQENERTQIPHATMKPKIASTDSPSTDYRLKRVAESPSLKDRTPEQFVHYIQKCVSSLHLQLQGEKEELEKVVAAMEQGVQDKDCQIASLKAELAMLDGVKEQKVKGRENQIALLQGDKEELEKVVAIMEHDVKDKNKEITSLKCMLKGVVEDQGPLLKAYTWKLLKTQAFASFLHSLTFSALKLGRHEAAEQVRKRYPDIPEEALVGLEDPLAASKLDNLLFDMIQDDAYEFPLLNHLLSLEEVPCSSQLKALDFDEDRDALIPP